MVNIGFLGAVSAGKTSLLRNFVYYLNKEMLNEIDKNNSYKLIKTDFSGESTQYLDGDKETKTIHPNRVFFRDHLGNSHTLFAPGGDRERAVVRMGIITISRIAKQVVLVFALDQDIKDQIEFFNSIRHFPKEVYVCFNKYDKFEFKGKDDELKQIDQFKAKITKNFRKRKIVIRDFFFTCAERFNNYENYNENAAKMILKVAVENTEKIEPQSNKQSIETKIAVS